MTHGDPRLSLVQNDSSGNPADTAPRITKLASPAADASLWWCSLATSSASIHLLERHLSPAELARAARFGTRELRDRYVAGRASLRTILGRALDIEPGSVEIVRGQRGRPQLAGASVPDFNISHTDDVAIVGITRCVRIGVDVERLDRRINVGGIARKMLTASERHALERLDPDVARRQVLTLWTCKEAMSKATGDALSAPFASLDVALDDANGGAPLAGPTARGADGVTRHRPSLRDGPAPYRPERWSLFAAPVPVEFVATVALWRRG